MQSVITELMPWKAEYSVNIQSIDAQHKRLVAMINELHAAMKEGKGKEIMGNIIKELARYTQYHFTYEETLFSRYGYPGSAAHKTEHDQFVARVSRFEEDLTRGSVTLSMEVMQFLKNWLASHILKTDKQYSDFLCSHGVK